MGLQKRDWAAGKDHRGQLQNGLNKKRWKAAAIDRLSTGTGEVVGEGEAIEGRL